MFVSVPTEYPVKYLYHNTDRMDMFRNPGHFMTTEEKITGRRAEREPITAPVKAADTATVRASFRKITAVRMKAADTEILRERISERMEAKMKAADTEILRMKIPEFIIVRTKTEEADTARRRIREHIIIRTKTEEADTVRRKIREPSAVRMKTEEAIYSRMMQRFRQKQRSWTAARKPMEFSRSFRTDMGLSAVKTFFRERMILMFLRPRSADLI